MSDQRAQLNEMKQFMAIAEGKDRPYVCHHNKKGEHECKADSSYGAAKKAAEHWGLKSTAGVSATLTDVKQSTQFVGEDAELTEINKDTVGSYLSKAAPLAQAGAEAALDAERRGDREEGDALMSKTVKRWHGIERAAAALLNQHGSDPEVAKHIEELKAMIELSRESREQIEYELDEGEEEENFPAQGSEQECAWWAGCNNEATTTEPHPVLGAVPICDRCADKLRKMDEGEDDHGLDSDTPRTPVDHCATCGGWGEIPHGDKDIPCPDCDAYIGEGDGKEFIDDYESKVADNNPCMYCDGEDADCEVCHGKDEMFEVGETSFDDYGAAPVYEADAECDRCCGTGRHPSRPEDCPECHGTGECPKVEEDGSDDLGIGMKSADYKNVGSKWAVQRSSYPVEYRHEIDPQYRHNEITTVHNSRKEALAQIKAEAQAYIAAFDDPSITHTRGSTEWHGRIPPDPRFREDSFDQKWSLHAVPQQKWIEDDFDESINLESIVESVLEEFPGQPKDYYDDPDDLGPMARGKSAIMKAHGAKDMPMSDFEQDEIDPEIEDEELGYRFD